MWGQEDSAARCSTRGPHTPRRSRRWGGRKGRGAKRSGPGGIPVGPTSKKPAPSAGFFVLGVKNGRVRKQVVSDLGPEFVQAKTDGEGF